MTLHLQEVSGFDLASGATGPPALAEQMLVPTGVEWAMAEKHGNVCKKSSIVNGK